MSTEINTSRIKHIKPSSQTSNLNEVVNDFFNNTDASKGIGQIGNSIITVNNVAAMQALANLTVGQKITTLGFYTPGDGGNNIYEVVALGTGTTSQGYIGGNPSVQFKGLFPADINAKQFGIVGDGIADDSLYIANAINTALYLNRKVIILNDTCYCPTAPLNKAEVVFIGVGKLLDIYKKEVINELATSTPFLFRDLDPKIHLKNFNSKIDPKVVLVGDSTGTWSADFIDTTSSLSHMLHERLVRYNPDKTIRFFNRCIGGMTFTDLDTKPTSNFPSWYTDTNASWLSYIADLEPDVVFINMGYNDGGNLKDTTIRSVADKIRAFAKPADIIFITPMAPSLSSTFSSGYHGSDVYQKGMENTAGLIRSLSQYYNYGLIDAHRLASILVEGVDPVDTYNERIDTNVIPANGIYESPVEVIDFSCRFRIDGDAATINNIFSIYVNKPLFFRLSGSDPVYNPEHGNYSAKDVVFFYKDDTSGCFRVIFYSDGSAPSPYRDVITDVLVPTSTFTMEVFKYRNTFGFHIVGNDNTRRIFNIICGGNKYKVLTGYFDALSAPAGPISEILFFNAGYPRKYRPSLAPSEVWGTPNNTAAMQLPNGGNGVNHYSSIGLVHILGQLFNRDVLSGFTNDLMPSYLTNHSENLGSYYTKILEIELTEGDTFDTTFMYQLTSDGVKVAYASGIITLRALANTGGDGLGYVNFQVGEIVAFDTNADDSDGILDFKAIVSQELSTGVNFKVDLYFRVGSNNYSRLKVVPLNCSLGYGPNSSGNYAFLSFQPIVGSLPPLRTIQASDKSISWINRPDTGIAAPTSTPRFVGQIYLDTVAKISYQAFGTTSSADWVALN